MSDSPPKRRLLRTWQPRFDTARQSDSFRESQRVTRRMQNAHTACRKRSMGNDNTRRQATGRSPCTLPFLDHPHPQRITVAARQDEPGNDTTCHSRRACMTPTPSIATASGAVSTPHSSSAARSRVTVQYSWGFGRQPKMPRPFPSQQGR